MGKGSRQGWAGLRRTCRPHIWARPGAALFPGEAALSLRGQWTSRQWEAAGWANMANPQCPQTTHILRFPFSTAPPRVTPLLSFRRYLLSTCYVRGLCQVLGCRDRSGPP